VKLILSFFFCLAATLVMAGSAQGPNQPVINIQTGVSISWSTRTNNTYQPEWLDRSGGSWNLLGATVPGDGTNHSLFDPSASGSRTYQVLEIVPGSPAAAAIPTNGGFESGNGTSASGWNVDTAAGGPVYVVRTNDNPHNGSFDFQAHLASAGTGPVVEFSQGGVPVTGGAAYPFTFYANALTGSSSYSAQWRVLWNAGGDTGYQSFTPGNNTYALISQTVTAPAAATSATLFIHLAGAAIPADSATIDFDDVMLGTASGPANPPVTNVLLATVQSTAMLTWATTADTQYQPVSSTNLAAEIWNSNYPIVLGDGGTHSMLFPLTNNTTFFRLQIPAPIIQPPANLQQVSAGATNAIGLAWTPSSALGITGYNVLYGIVTNQLSNSLALGNVNSVILTNLVPGQTYYLAVVTLTSNGQSTPTSVIAAQPDTTIGIVPLFDAATVLEPDTVSNTSTALVTYLGDRARDRHARESQFMLYDHYLSWYWQQRVARIQIIDHVAKGGTDVTFNYTTRDQLNPAEFRTFFRGITTVAEYNNNQEATLVSTNASSFAGETDFNYTAKLTANAQFNRPLQLGDRIEIEISQFLLNPTNGRNNYYGTVLLYVVGQGIVPWEEGQDIGLTGGVVGGVNQNLDSYPLPTNAWLGGKTTLPYQYSNEPTNRFKELAGDISPTNAELFMLGRRLHHTDFGNGTHSEPDNPIFTEQIGKLGPKFVNRSCVACHVNNGRALPPAIGSPMLQSVVKVGSDAKGSPDPILGSELQSQNTSGPPEGGVTISSYTTINGQYGDGTTYTLQKPNYTFMGVTPKFFSVRLAPQLVGLGLLEAVSENSIMALANTTGTNQAGANVSTVSDPQTRQLRVGRFGYKAGKARLSHQIAGAFNNDMGVTSSIFPILDGDTTNSPVELSDGDLDKLTRYIALLGVGARRNLTNAQALHGEQLFASANCVSCHVPTLTTSQYHPFAELRNQTIHPYTDLLLHDMGPGLADNMGEGNATGAQWRTTPLWSIGLAAGVSGGEAYLHDGRARSLDEAILWHDGDGAAAKEAFRTMSSSDRADLVAFLKSL
jgi:CxxC motif-containing protein (DUF1111 family)